MSGGYLILKGIKSAVWAKVIFKRVKPVAWAGFIF